MIELFQHRYHRFNAFNELYNTQRVISGTECWSMCKGMGVRTAGRKVHGGGMTSAVVRTLHESNVIDQTNTFHANVEWPWGYEEKHHNEKK